jgi:glycerol uptake facilitator-like aquaporin
MPGVITFSPGDRSERFLVRDCGGNGPLLGNEAPVGEVRVGVYLLLLLLLVAGITEMPAADGRTAGARFSGAALGWGDGEVDTTTGGSPIHLIAMPCCTAVLASMLL